MELAPLLLASLASLCDTLHGIGTAGRQRMAVVFMRRFVPDSGASADMMFQGKSRRVEWGGLGSGKQSLHFDLSQDDD